MQDKIKDNQQNLATIIPDLASMAAELVRDLDPQARAAMHKANVEGL
jgi:hypothetical protein